MIEASCHCGAVRLEIEKAPTEITDCNCSICRRYGVLWAYYTLDQVRLRSVAGTGHLRMGSEGHDISSLPDVWLRYALGAGRSSPQPHRRQYSPDGSSRPGTSSHSPSRWREYRAIHRLSRRLRCAGRAACTRQSLSHDQGPLALRRVTLVIRIVRKSRLAALQQRGCS